MGWTWYPAQHFKKGRIDRIEECRKELGYACIVADGMVGSVYYGAIRIDENRVVAVVMLTKTSGYEFGYKDMDETMEPYYYECPLKVLKVLTPTDNENAIRWREKCIKYREDKKAKINLGKLPIGTKVEVSIPYNTTYYNENEVVVLEKIKYRKTSTWVNASHSIRFTNRFMKTCVENNKVKVL